MLSMAYPPRNGSSLRSKGSAWMRDASWDSGETALSPRALSRRPDIRQQEAFMGTVTAYPRTSLFLAILQA